MKDPANPVCRTISTLLSRIGDKWTVLVVQTLGHQELLQAFGTQPVTGEQLVEHIWKQLVSSFSLERLSNVRLVQSRDLSFEYAG